jgi:ATP-dependent Clp protease protease subunit
MPKKFWKLTNAVDSSGSTLYLDGEISQESWWGDEVTPQSFRDELKTITSKDLTVVINSGGGDVWAGVSIHDALKELDANVTVKVSGLAASIASVIAMAGDKIIMSTGSTMMIHRASMLAMGNADDMKKAIEMLETVEDGIVTIYSERTGQTTEAIKTMLDNETWISADKAVELGFADEVSKPEKDEPVVENMMSGNFAFSMKATKTSLDSYLTKVANCDKEEENVDKSDETETVEQTEAPAEEVKEETQVTEVTTETVEVVEPVEENKPTNKLKETEMSEVKTDPIAQAQVIEPAKQATVEVKAKAQDYLKSRASIEDYAKILVQNAGNTATEVKDAWSQHLVKMGITNPEILLPTALITSIEDAFEQGGEIWNLVNKTGLSVFRATRDTVTGENSRAAGYNREDEATKREELITLADRVIRPQFIYKYITLNKEDIKENRDTGALVSYVLTELPRRIVREVERAIVIGDGRVDGSDYKIASFISLKDDAADTPGVFVAQYSPAVSETKYESLIRSRALVKAEGAKYLVAKTDYLTDLLLEQGVNGGYLFQPGTNVAGVFGFAGVISPDWLDEDTDNDAYIFVPSAYTTVGDNTIEAFTNFLLSTNKQEYLQEIYAGGAVTKLNAAVAIGAEASS